MNKTLKEELEKTIIANLQQASDRTLEHAIEAMQYAQAALNATQALVMLLPYLPDKE